MNATREIADFIGQGIEDMEAKLKRLATINYDVARWPRCIGCGQLTDPGKLVAQWYCSDKCFRADDRNDE
jgi:hypothetical protein